ncbi:MAG: Spy/CpxP family protein refolding chaperone [Gammaproteobacteria bacterium]|nr:Spy/CpxP family protein refolding chaperone [Gammaproteobacteria bacterium]
MRLISAKTFGIAALVLGLAWAAVEAEEMTMRRQGGAFCMSDEGPGLGDGMHGPMMMATPMMSDPMHLVHMAEELDLSADQRKQAGAIMDGAMPKMRGLMFRMADSRKALHEFMEGDQKDEGALRKIADEHGKVMSEMMFLGMKTHADMRAVLTEEQLKELDEFRQHRHGFGRHKFNKRLDD